MNYTTAVANYVAELAFDQIPASAVLAAKRITLDYLGVTLAAIRYPAGAIITRYVKDLGGTPQSTVIGTTIKTSTSNAALANGTLSADMELDDVHPSANLHASSVFLSAALPVAEACGATGKDWITAVVAAYDIGCRLSKAMGDRNQYARGFHPTAVSGIFGAAAAAAKLLKLDTATIESAFGLTGCQASGLLTWEQEQEHFTKCFQSGVPARNAVTAVELASRGYVGAPDTLDGKYNVFDAFAGRRNFPALLAGLGSWFDVEHTGYKFYACCRGIHATLDAVLELSRKNNLAAADMDAIDVWIPDQTAALVDNSDLTTHNLQHIVSAALHDGKVHREQCSAERRQDPSVRTLAGRITVSSDPEISKAYPEHWGAKVLIRTKTGKQHQLKVDDPQGTDTRPVREEDIIAKFQQMAGTVLPDEHLEELITTVNRLESLPSIQPLARLLTID